MKEERYCHVKHRTEKTISECPQCKKNKMVTVYENEYASSATFRDELRRAEMIFNQGPGHALYGVNDSNLYQTWKDANSRPNFVGSVYLLEVEVSRKEEYRIPATGTRSRYHILSATRLTSESAAGAYSLAVVDRYRALSQRSNSDSMQLGTSGFGSFHQSSNFLG